MLITGIIIAMCVRHNELLNNAGSRDSNMALWSIPSGCDTSKGQDTEDKTNLAECVPVIEPIFTFSNLSSEPHTLATNGERVRSLAYCCHSCVC